MEIVHLVEKLEFNVLNSRLFECVLEWYVTRRQGMES
jgi:hypothetical protein